MDDLRTELAAVLNKHSVEGRSDTPDFILAQYLIDCLFSFEQITRAREKWHGRPEPAQLGSAPPAGGRE